MREPHIEGVATHDDPESCAGIREGAREAFDRGTCGLEQYNRERKEIRGADALSQRGRPHDRHRKREMPVDPARSKTPARTESFCARTGRPLGSPGKMEAWAASGRPEAASR
jgi:hypothetical protein